MAKFSCCFHLWLVFIFIFFDLFFCVVEGDEAGVDGGIFRVFGDDGDRVWGDDRGGWVFVLLVVC